MLVHDCSCHFRLGHVFMRVCINWNCTGTLTQSCIGDEDYCNYGSVLRQIWEIQHTQQMAKIATTIVKLNFFLAMQWH